MSTDVEDADAGKDGNTADGARGARLLSRHGQISIGAILSLLMAAIIVPSLIFSLLLIQRNDRAQQEMVTTLAEATAGSIAETVDRQLAGMLTTLRVLSTSFAVERGDLADFYHRAREALQGTDDYLLAIDGDMNQLLNTRVDYGTPLGPIADVETVARALEASQPAFSNAFVGRTSQRWVFNVVLPLPPGSAPVSALILTQDAERLSASLASQNLRGGWNAVLVDRRGVVLASSFMSSDIGKPFFLLGEGRSRPTTVRSSLRFEGKSYEAIRAFSSHAGWEAIVWAPTEVVQAPMTRTLRVLALGGLAIIALGATLAWLLGHQVTKPVRQLARDAHRLGAGKEVEPVVYPVTEITTVSLALAQASKDRQAAENEIRFLMREVAHRSKNQLTVVSAMAKQSARHARTFAAFQDSFQKRVYGLARSTDLLLAGGVAGVEMRVLLEAQIEPFKPSDDTRLELRGPQFRLSNQAAQTIGLAVHELSTNAAKYGAFAVPEGRLVVTWKRRGENLDLVWREYVPRLRRRSRKRGFGTEVIERMLGGSLAAQIQRTAHRDGLEYRFTMPLDRLGQELSGEEDAEDEA